MDAQRGGGGDILYGSQILTDFIEIWTENRDFRVLDFFRFFGPGDHNSGSIFKKLGSF